MCWVCAWQDTSARGPIAVPPSLAGSLAGNPHAGREFMVRLMHDQSCRGNKTVDSVADVHKVDILLELVAEELRPGKKSPFEALHQLWDENSVCKQDRKHTFCEIRGG